MLLAEDLLLLLTDDRTGKLGALEPRDVARAAPCSIDLLSRATREVSASGRLLVVDREPDADPLLDEALVTVDRKKGRRPKDVVSPLREAPRHGSTLGSSARGLVREDAGRILGIVPRRRWPAVDAAHEDAVRAASPRRCAPAPQTMRGPAPYRASARADAVRGLRFPPTSA